MQITTQEHLFDTLAAGLGGAVDNFTVNVTGEQEHDSRGIRAALTSPKGQDKNRLAFDPNTGRWGGITVGSEFEGPVQFEFDRLVKAIRFNLRSYGPVRFETSRGGKPTAEAFERIQGSVDRSAFVGLVDESGFDNLVVHPSKRGWYFEGSVAGMASEIISK